MTHYAKRTEKAAPTLVAVNSDGLERALRGLHGSIVAAEDALVDAAEREQKLASLDHLRTGDLKSAYPALNA